MSDYSDRAVFQARSLLESIYDSVRTGFPNFVVHELEDSVTVARAYLTGTATIQDYDMLRGWTGSESPIKWATFCNERNDMNHVYRLARMNQGNNYRKLESDVVDKNDVEVATRMREWCDVTETLLEDLPIGDEAKANALHQIAGLRLRYAVETG